MCVSCLLDCGVCFAIDCLFLFVSVELVVCVCGMLNRVLLFALVRAVVIVVCCVCASSCVFGLCARV